MRVKSLRHPKSVALSAVLVLFSFTITSQAELLAHWSFDGDTALTNGYQDVSGSGLDVTSSTPPNHVVTGMKFANGAFGVGAG